MAPNTPRARPGQGTRSHQDGHGGGTLYGHANPAGELAAWGAAVEHLHAAGLPAAVPELAAAWLRRRGVRADWTVAA
jgi:hypothetical protein